MADSLLTELESLISGSTGASKLLTAVEVVNEDGACSASIAVLHHGEILSHCISAVGNDTDTLFQACSISKPVAGLCAMKLIEQGKFDVDDKIVDLLPQSVLSVISNDTRTRALFKTITVKHLMTHTAGLSIHGFGGYKQGSQIPTTIEILQGKPPSNTSTVQVCTPPGLAHMYSGGGFTVLQCIMEHVTNLSFPELMHKTVFEPLGMSRSFYSLSKDEENFARVYYNGYQPHEDGWHTQPELAAAGLWTTPTDLLRVTRAVQHSLKADTNTADSGEAFLKRETAEMMLTDVMNGMGLTWFVDAHFFDHEGANNPGFRAIVVGSADLPWNPSARSSTSGDEEAKEQRPKNHEEEDTEKGKENWGDAEYGISIMCNSEVADSAKWKIFYAIAYLQGWKYVPTVCGQQVVYAPFAIYQKGETASVVVDDKWRDWKGEWDRSWELGEDDDHNPTAGITNSLTTRTTTTTKEQGEKVMSVLRPAAIPSRRYADGKKSIDLVMDGLEVMLRLGWDGDDKVIEVWNGGTNSITTLTGESTRP